MWELGSNECNEDEDEDEDVDDDYELPRLFLDK